MHIVGSFALGPDFMTDGTAMMSPGTFAALLTGNAATCAAPCRSSSASSRCVRGATIDAVGQALRAALPAEVRVLSKPELVAFERAFQADLSSAGPIFWMGTVVGFIVGMLISYQVVYTDLSDQLPQYATLKGMGYGTGYLVRVVFEQAALSAVAAYIPAWLLCLVVYRVVSEFTLAAAAHDVEPDPAQLRADTRHVPAFREPGDPPGDRARSRRGVLMAMPAPVDFSPALPDDAAAPVARAERVNFHYGEGESGSRCCSTSDSRSCRGSFS